MYDSIGAKCRFRLARSVGLELARSVGLELARSVGLELARSVGFKIGADMHSFRCRLKTKINHIFYSKTQKKSILRWNIVFVWLLNRTHYPHKSYIQLQNAKKIVYCEGILCLCGL